jgi:hypothetical protein
MKFARKRLRGDVRRHDTRERALVVGAAHVGNGLRHARGIPPNEAKSH